MKTIFKYFRVQRATAVEVPLIWKVCLFLVCVFFIKTAYPVNYYVNDNSTTGDVYCTAIGVAWPTNNGLSPSAPVTSVQAIINNYVLGPNDVVYIDAGTYNESISITNADDGTSAGFVKFLGAGYTNTIFNAVAGSNNVTMGTNTSNYDVEYVWIEGIRFNNANSGYYNISKYYGDYTYIKDCYLQISNAGGLSNIYFRANTNTAISSYNCTITGNIITNSSSAGAGIYFYGDCDNNTISNNTITLSGSNAGAYGLWFRYYDDGGSNKYWPVNNTVTGNNISSNLRGISLSGGSSTVNSLWGYTISGNSINIGSNSGSNNSGIWMNYAGNFGHSGQSDNIINANIITNGYAGIYIYDYATGNKITNNYICKSTFGLMNNENDAGDESINLFLHNSLYTTGSCMYFYNASQRGWDVRNNILYTTSSNTSSACIYMTNETFDWEMRYSNANIYYTPNGARIGYYNGTYYSTILTWRGIDHTANGSNEGNSLNTDPNYNNVSTCDLSLKDNTGIVGENLMSVVGTDIMGNARTHPHIGAFEGAQTLPVELIYFTASCMQDYVQVAWSTASELNCDYYDLESSSDGSSWKTIYITSGAGTVNKTLAYSFKDINFTGLTYYRLTQYDYDGKYTTYGAVAADCKRVEGKSVNVYPNKTESYVNIAIPDATTKLSYILTNSLGKMLQRGELQEKNNRLNLETYQKGIYYLIIETPERLVYKIVRY